MSGEEKVVCVTGASGYIASWLVKLLLQSGYTVKATVRDTKDLKKTEHLLALDGAKERLKLFKADLLDEGSFDSAVDGCQALATNNLAFQLNSLHLYSTEDLKKTEHLLALDGAKERLKLFKADLLDEGSFDSAVDGCQGVFHTASPVLMTASDPQSQLIDPAVKGTLNVLRSCAKVPSIKRVIITSSMASVMFNGKTLSPDVVIDETWFSDPISCEKLKLWYMLSKTLAEEAAWKFAEENDIDLVAINPGLVIGPLIEPTLGFSLETFLNLVKGTEVFPDGMCILVDVRDVANAHIQAFEIPAASGRYCIVAKVIHYFEVFKILHGLYPTFNLLEKCEDDKPLLPAYKISQDKAKSLGISFVPLEVTLRDTMESFKDYGFLTI
ncbi:tetraketide alpha-pyrone reductase 1 [Quercus suber]|uniref:Tetraketide alpha-pyrone reductase 1 n=1 Tax=Quercus suber TaxID=58331 RepID=A0AAW0LI05_QUESU